MKRGLAADSDSFRKQAQEAAPNAAALKQQANKRMKRGNFEIGRILHLKSEIRNLKLDGSCGERNELIPNSLARGAARVLSRLRT